MMSKVIVQSGAALRGLDHLVDRVGQTVRTHMRTPKPPKAAPSKRLAKTA